MSPKNFRNISHPEQKISIYWPNFSERRSSLSLKFALKCVRTPYTNKMFPINRNRHTRESEFFHVEYARTERFKRSAIPTMARQLNDFYKSKK